MVDRWDRNFPTEIVLVYPMENDVMVCMPVR